MSGLDLHAALLGEEVRAARGPASSPLPRRLLAAVTGLATFGLATSWLSSRLNLPAPPSGHTIGSMGSTMAERDHVKHDHAQPASQTRRNGVQPGPPSLLQGLLSGSSSSRQEPSCLFVYGKMLELLQDGEERGWEKGAHGSSGQLQGFLVDEEHILAQQTSRRTDTLSGRLLCWDSPARVAFSHALHIADDMANKLGKKGQTRRAKGDVQKADGTSQSSYFHFSSSAESQPASTPSASSGHTRPLRVVVVGGGPVGLVVAKGLANRLGHDACIITVLEAEPRERFSKENYRDISFIYNLARGNPERLLSEGIWLADDLVGTSACPGGGAEYVQFDGAARAVKELPAVNRALLNGTLFIQRADMVRALHTSLSRSPNVQLRFAARCTHLEEDEQGIMQVYTAGQAEPLEAELVIGADGRQSPVRSSLHASLTRKARFQTVKTRQKSSGMRFKSLRLTLDPSLLPAGATGRVSGFDTLSGTFFPESGASPRLLNMPAWDVSQETLFQTNLTESRLRAYLEEKVPSVPWASALSQEDAQTFCRAGQGITFPDVSYCADAVYISHTQRAAVALCGDAMHAFPPDCGQGLNAGLEDAWRLIDALTPEKGERLGSVSGAALSPALLSRLERYNEQTVQEAKAVWLISQVFFPYQYPVVPKDVGFVYWAARNLWAFASNAVLPSLFSPPVAVHTYKQRPAKGGKDITEGAASTVAAYSEVAAGYERHTKSLARLTGVLLGAAAVALGRKLGQ